MLLLPSASWTGRVGEYAQHLGQGTPLYGAGADRQEQAHDNQGNEQKVFPYPALNAVNHAGGASGRGVNVLNKIYK